MSPRVAVLGASGFVGSHVASALEERGAHVIAARAPRLGQRSARDNAAYLKQTLIGCDVVVNAAGIADATGCENDLDLANHQLPRLLAQVTATLGIRLVHVSSAAVQGRRAVLDSKPEYAAFSPYSASKAAGERAVIASQADVCAYRPPGVHGTGRPVTRSLVRLARSPLASVSAPGTQNTPQALIENVADAVAFLALYDGELPRVVHHPSEGLSVESLLQILSGRSPRQVRRSAAKAGIRMLFFAARASPGLEGHVRRLEVLWLGQQQAFSWLSEAGWKPVTGPEKWAQLGEEVWKQVKVAQRRTRQERT